MLDHLAVHVLIMQSIYILILPSYLIELGTFEHEMITYYLRKCSKLLCSVPVKGHGYLFLIHLIEKSEAWLPLFQLYCTVGRCFPFIFFVSFSINDYPTIVTFFFFSSSCKPCGFDLTHDFLKPYLGISTLWCVWKNIWNFLLL